MIGGFSIYSQTSNDGSSRCWHGLIGAVVGMEKGKNAQ